jgi:hypothetical protein
VTEYETKHSGQSEEYASGMKRDTQEGKPRFDLITPRALPYTETMAYRRAMLMARGAKHYGDRNWELGSGQEELERAQASAERHMRQWLAGETDEDHAAACQFNIDAAEYFKWKIEQDELHPHDETMTRQLHRMQSKVKDVMAAVGRESGGLIYAKPTPLTPAEYHREALQRGLDRDQRGE